LESINYPKSLKETGSSIYKGCTSLKSITIPEGVTKIPENAFAYAESLRIINFSETIESIGDSAFNGCKGLPSIQFNEGLKFIGEYAFYGCTGLISVEIPQKLEVIDYYAFGECTNLSNVTVMGHALNTIDNYAFANCSKLRSIYLPESLKEIGNNTFVNCNNLTFYCPYISSATLYAISRNIPFIVSEMDYTNGTNGIVNKDGTYFYADADGQAYNGYVLFSLEYKLKEAEEYSNKKIEIYIPKNSELKESTIKVDGVLCQNYEYEESVLTIPVTKSESKIEFYVIPSDAEKVTSYAQLLYQNGNKTESEILGIINENIANLTITCDDTTSNSTFTVSGYGLKQGIVSIYLNDIKLEDVNTSKTGKYSTTITLTNPKEDSDYIVKAECKDGSNVYTAQSIVTYTAKSPELKSLKLYYNNHADAGIDLLDTTTTPYVSFNPSVPFTFTADFTNEEQIENVYIVSTRNNEKKYMEATYNEKKGLYVASGYFDDLNHSYVPGKISVDINKKREQAVISSSLVVDTSNITDAMKKTSVQQIITGKPNEEKYRFDITDTLLEMGKDVEETFVDVAISQFDDMTDMNAGEYWGLLEAIETGMGYFIPDENGNNWFVTADWSDGATYTLLAKDVSGASNKIVKYVISTQSPGEWGTINEVAPYLGLASTGVSAIHTIYGYKGDHEELREEIMMNSSITDKTGALKKADELYADQCTYTVMIAILPLLVSTIGITGPVAIGFSALCGLIGATSSFFWQARIAQIKGQAISLRWAIDPSGYVYESVTSNRIPGVTTTAYYKEKLTDEKAILWDASEYDQMNPLITDMDGKYAWDVPEGFWQVKYEKEGYETTYSEWLLVPPPQTEVNIRMVPTANLTVDAVNVYADHAEVVFSQYVIPETASNITLKDADGKTIEYTMEYNTSETDSAGIVYAKTYQLIYKDRELAHDEKLTVDVPETTLSADSKSCEETSITKACSKPLGVSATEKMTIAMGESHLIPVTVENYSEEYNIIAISEYGYVVSVDADVQVDESGTGYIAVKGELYGNSAITVSCDDRVLATIQITVSRESTGYSISYVLNGGIQNQSNPQSYQSTDADIVLEAPTREGYIFEGWYSDSDFVTKVTRIEKGSTEDKTLYAKWREVAKNPFADVKENSWQYTYVKFAVDNNLMAGKGKDAEGNIIFDPDKNMTRAEFVQTLYNKEGKPAVTYTNKFTDVPESAWFAKAIIWASDNGIVAGKGDKFDVNGNITREEVATILCKYATNYKQYDTSGRASLDAYEDKATISNWAVNNMSWAINYGVMKGRGTKLAPRDKATRAECATMLKNFMDAYEK